FVSPSGKIRRIAASGGAPQDICDAPDGFSGGTWNRDGVVLLGTPAGIARVPADGGKPKLITTIAGNESGHFWPRFLPDGQHFLFLAHGDAATSAIFVGTLGSDARTKVLAVDSNAAYTEPGYLVFHRDDAVFAQPFQLKTFTVSGEEARIASDVAVGATEASFDVSENGVLIYHVLPTGGNVGGSASWPLRMGWGDRAAQLVG